MKNLRLFLAAVALALFAPLAHNHPALSVLLLLTGLGAFLPSEFALRETRLGTNTITLSGLTEILFKSRDIVARELAGGIKAVMVNGGSEGISLGGTVTSMKTAQPTLNTSYTPAMTIPSGDDQTISSETLTIGQTANVKIPLTGETTLQLINTIGFEAAITQLMTQAMRTIVNAIESHVCTVAKNGASRATGTAGTTPFSSDIGALADLRQILVDNGMTPPEQDGMSSVVLGTSAGTAMRKLSNLYKVNEGGDANLLRRGELSNLYGFSIKETAGVASHTKGTGASSTTTNAGFAIGATSLALASAGTGTLVAGDVVTFAGDTANKYVVRTGDADVSDGGTLVLNDPGIRLAMSAATKAITVGANYTGNFACHRSAIELAMRPPAMPPNLSGGRGDAATDRVTLYDPETGLVFEAAVYLGYGMNLVDITTFYQAKVWKSNFVAALLG